MKKITEFKTHDGNIIKGKILDSAMHSVADDLEELANRIKKENPKLGDITEDIKKSAQRVRNGFLDNFTVMQRVNTKLTGKCIGLLGVN